MKLSLLLFTTFITMVYCAPNIGIEESLKEKLALENFNVTKVFNN